MNDTQIKYLTPVECPDSHDFRTAIVMYADRLGQTVINTHDEEKCQKAIHSRMQTFIQYSIITGMVGGYNVKHDGWKIRIHFVNIIGEDPGELLLDFSPSLDQLFIDAAIRITKHIDEFIKNLK